MMFSRCTAKQDLLHSLSKQFPIVVSLSKQFPKQFPDNESLQDSQWDSNKESRAGYIMQPSFRSLYACLVPLALLLFV